MSEEAVESTQQGQNNKRSRLRKGVNFATKTIPDAEDANVALKPLTRSREKANSQSQAKSVQMTSTSTNESQVIVQTKIPNGSGITIVRKQLAKS